MTIDCFSCVHGDDCKFGKASCGMEGAYFRRASDEVIAARREEVEGNARDPDLSPLMLKAQDMWDGGWINGWDDLGHAFEDVVKKHQHEIDRLRARMAELDAEAERLSAHATELRSQRDKYKAILDRLTDDLVNPVAVAKNLVEMNRRVNAEVDRLRAGIKALIVGDYETCTVEGCDACLSDAMHRLLDGEVK